MRPNQKHNAKSKDKQKQKQTQMEIEYNSEAEEQAELSKLQNLSNYMKQISLHISATIKEPSLRDYLRTVVENFDRAIDEYNSEYLDKRINHLIFFKIEMIALSRNDAAFVEEVFYRIGNGEIYGPYFARMLFLREELEDEAPRFGIKRPNQPIHERNYYRMHVELWKKGESGNETNSVLSAFEKSCMNELLDNLTEKGYVSNVEGSAIYLKTKKPLYQSVVKFAQNSLLELLKGIVSNFLLKLSKILLFHTQCTKCQKYLIFEERMKVMMPPTTNIWKEKEKNKEDQAQRIHQTCLLNYLRPPSIPNDFKPRQNHANVI